MDSELTNIGAVKALNQGVATTDSPSFAGLTLSGVPTAPTAVAGTNTAQIATTEFTTTAIANLVDSAPATLDTLNELAAALGDDPNFATTVSNSIGTKWTQDNTKISNWDTAYGWGNHASAGYLVSSSYTASDVLTKIKTVNGSGSGLDADLLDGQQGSYYATAASVSAIAALDPVITLTGAVTGSGTMTNLGNVSIATTATADPTLTLTGDVSGSATFTNLGNATLTAVVADDSHNHIISNVDGLQTELDGKLNLTDAGPLATFAATGVPTASISTGKIVLNSGSMTFTTGTATKNNTVVLDTTTGNNAIEVYEGTTLRVKIGKL